ncbi:uncharacterized protein LOC141596780 [Silene latifolia]|uniref:uncharacterized protein LOC141596780 n=1 Tax=Silene latifolia TaxID=37657 RepID=UPI003D782CBE
MALNFSSAAANKAFFGNLLPKNKDFIKLYIPLSSSLGTHLRVAAAQSEGSQARFTTQEEKQDSASSDTGPSSSARAQLGLLQQLTSASTDDEGESGLSGQGTIREQLMQLVGDRDDDFIIPLGKNLKKVSPKALTISQKRNIRRQTYLNEVSQRNDSVFFATIGAFVLLPPLVILGIAILTGYVQLFP